VVGSVFVGAGVTVRFELVRPSEVSVDTAVESTSAARVATIAVVEGVLDLVATAFGTACLLALVDHPHVLPFVSISSSRLLSDDSGSLIGLVLGGAWVLVSYELIGSCEVCSHSTVETTCRTLSLHLALFEGALELVSRAFRVLLGDPLLVNPDVFTLVAVSSPR